MAAEELQSRRLLREKALKDLAFKQKLAQAGQALRGHPAFKLLITEHFLRDSLKENLKRQYLTEEDQDGNAKQREIHGRVCLQTFLDNLESDKDRAQGYLDLYNKGLEELERMQQMQTKQTVQHLQNLGG